MDYCCTNRQDVMKKLSLYFIGCFLLLGILAAGCSNLPTPTDTQSVTMTLKPGEEKAFKVPWQETNTRVTITSDIPVTIFIEDEADTIIHRNNFSINKIFSSNGMITVSNNNIQSTTVNVLLAREG